MSAREATARAMAFFDGCDDIVLLHQLGVEIAPKVRRLVAQELTKVTEDALPGPAELRPARESANKEEAIATLRRTNDFSLLQVLARSIGRRVETIEIAASADFPEGARVEVPEQPSFPPKGRTLAGTVEVTGTQLQVALDNGETWEGAPSLAKLLRG
jgi:hypothetical protein